MDQPAIGLIETNSIVRGIHSCDKIVKKAPVEVLESAAICPGKYIVLFWGPVAEVEESLTEGRNFAAEFLVDYLFLPNVHLDIIPAISGTTRIDKIQSVGAIETFSVASTILSADAAAKAANVKLIEIRLARGLGGKAFFTLTGELFEVEAAIDAAVTQAKSTGNLVCSEVIASPREDLNRFLI